MRRIGKMDNAMKKILTISVLAGLVLCGCQKEELIIEKTPEQKTFTAEIENSSDDVATKTSLGDQGKVLWNTDDKVSIFAGNTVNAQYQVSEVTDENTRAVLSPVSGSESETSAETISGNVAYYPYSSSATIAAADGAYTISGIELPATQTYTEGSFGSGAFPMAAVAENTSLKFKNILGGLKLQLTGTAKVRSISVSGNNNEILCGSANVTVSSSNVPAITLSDSKATIVTLDCGTEGVQLNEATATPFVIALPPVTMSSGFTVTVADTDGNEMEITTTKSKTISRSQLLKMAAKEYKADESPFTITSVYNTQSVAFYSSGNPSSISLEYKKNNDAWATYNVGTPIDFEGGDVVKFRAGKGGNETFSNDGNNFYHISVLGYSGTSSAKVSGNIMSLLDRTLAKTEVPEYAFAYLFASSPNLTDAANLKLPATTLAKDCYTSMFRSCTALTAAPELPAENLAVDCYSYMFYGCTSLETVPDLKATTLAWQCYFNMFKGCTSLKTAPKLSATTLADYCYSGMFEGCTSLTTAPELPVTTLADCCYYLMFSGCTSLTTAPELPAAELKWGCYYNMFENCVKLNSVKALFTKYPSEETLKKCINHWLDGAGTSGGTVYKNSAASWTADDLILPTGWTVADAG